MSVLRFTVLDFDYAALSRVRPYSPFLQPVQASAHVLQ